MPTEIWMSNDVEHLSLLYKGDGSGNFTLGRHCMQADVPVRPACLEGCQALSRIAARISTTQLSIMKTGSSEIEVESKDGRHRPLSHDNSVLLEDATAIWFPFEPKLRWQVMSGHGAISLLLIEQPLPIKHVIPMPGVGFNQWRRIWNAHWCARDTDGWHIDELVAAGEISPRVASLMAHVYRA